MKQYCKISSLFVWIILFLVIFAAPLSPAAPVLAQEEGPTLPEDPPPPGSITELGSSPTFFEVISGGSFHTCGIRTNGTLKCWGLNDGGQSTPPSGTFIQVSAGDKHTCGIKTNGTAACWGKDEDGQANTPSGTFSQISAGSYHNCGIRTNGNLFCWGSNNDGESTPPSGTFTQVSAGAWHTCGIKNDGTVKCWGNNNVNQATPPSGAFSQISAGGHHTCGIRTNGTLKCWGLNDDGQSIPPSGTFSQVSAGDWHTCGIKTNGTVDCWGKNDDGQSLEPIYTFSQISAGKNFDCGIKTNGSAFCWYINDYGQTSPPSGTFGPPPGMPSSYRPSGDTYSSKPSYSWKRILNATSYHVFVFNVSTSTTVVNQTISSDYCSATTNRCSFAPSTTLTKNQNYRWKVSAANLWGRSDSTPPRYFKVLPGFNSTFNGSYTGWSKHPGGTWHTTSATFYTNGATGKYSSASYNTTFKDFTYQARVKQPGTNPSSLYGLVVRGSPTFNSKNNWSNGLFFVINNAGKYKIYKTVSGTPIGIKGATASSTIHKNTWNSLKVIADGSHYKFYINNTLVWSGTDTSRTSGRVGLLSYSNSSAEKFYADWATLTMTYYYINPCLNQTALTIPTFILEDPPADPEAQP